MIRNNDLTSILWRSACVVLSASALSACDRPERTTNQAAVVTAAADEGAVASTLTVFDLSPTEKDTLSEKALSGDAEASFRLAQYYSLAGSDNDPSTNDELDHQQEKRWLELATKQGHPAAELNLAITLAADDCPRARSMMIKIRDSSPDAGRRDRATGWLGEPSFACRR